ncbi:aminopeptidase P, putative [Plasmodium ovale]|uniref:Aminopeptidase P, putative n=3 Tax=Plasmodium ovale TaxID=36330 RepID=A0A1A8W4K5_PLAOA|nr:aminopeptidase P, putative [Plasmodium ovale curtisi]SCP05739.1 aminopeptidase P, putative [Plasmodium ovale]
MNSLVYSSLLLMVLHVNFLFKGNRVNYVSAYISAIHNYSGLSKHIDANDFNNSKIDATGSTSKNISGNYFKKKFNKGCEKNSNFLRESKKDDSQAINSTSTTERDNSDNNNGTGSGSGRNTSTMGAYVQRLNDLKKLMVQHNIDVYILINSDEHNSEIINDKDKKIYYLSNYSGADGVLIVTKGKPILYVNALYELQANNELDKDVFTLRVSKISNRDEIYETIASLEFSNIAFDGKNTSVSFYEKLKKKIASSYPEKSITEKVIYQKDVDDINKDGNLNFLILEKSLVDVANNDVNDKSIYIHDRKYNGACSGEKLEKLRQHFSFENKNVDSLLLSELDEIAYLLNLRGYDYKFSPLFYSYVYIHFNREKDDFDKIILFTTSKNLTDGSKRHLNTINVTVKEYEEVVPYLRDNVSTKGKQDHTKKEVITSSPAPQTYDISLSPYINLIVYMLFDKEKIQLQKSAVVDMKAVKNDVEMENMKEAHVLDSLALLQFFHWCDEKRKTKELFNETEISLKNKIDYFRSTKNNFLFPSFSTISAIGANAAVIHYESTELTNTKISPSIYLLDSGGQYLHGTTDVTRTTHFGEPTAEEKKIYTLVLKGHLHLRKVIFTNYTNSMSLDFIARENLFKHFLDYNHGTGHGVGLFLNVHEGGCSISPVSGTPLKPNMVLSNEPGYYMENHFGVRIENMQYVINKKTVDGTEFLSFQDLTLYPYEKKLLDFSLLTTEEIKDINEYHDTIRKTLLPILNKNPSEYGEGVVKYLMEITKPIAVN